MQIKEEQFNDKEPQLKKSVADFLNAYMQPSFGSMSKRDIDIKLFCLMQDLGLIDANPSIYEVQCKLKVTNSKARSLIYAAELSKWQVQDNGETPALEELLKEVLQKPIITMDTTKMIGLDIDNPLLKDYIKQKLKENHLALDWSFSPTLVRLTPSAFIFLIDKYVNQQKWNDCALQVASIITGLNNIHLENENIIGDTEDGEHKTICARKHLFKTFIEKLIEKLQDQSADTVIEKMRNIMNSLFGADLNLIEQIQNFFN